MEVTILQTWPATALNGFFAKIQFPQDDKPSSGKEYTTNFNEIIRIRGVQMYQTPNLKELYDDMDKGIFYCLIEYID